MTKCKQCDNPLVWIGSLHEGKLECNECKKGIPKYEHHVHGQNTANEAWVNIYAGVDDDN